MKFRTELNLPPSDRDRLLDHRSTTLLVGSCFSEHMAKKMRRAGFRVLENPHGILFNPTSIVKALGDYLDQRVYTREDLLFNGEQWVSLGHHGRFNEADPEKVLERINESIRAGHDHLLKCTHLVLTLGTSWVYRHLERERIVANCHKIPQKEFRKELLSVEEMVSGLEKVLARIRQIRPQITILLTVSPVRHLRDGLVENARSKARLLEVAHQLSERENTHYFPSYEMLMDDLRDYRFYEPDMIHPNQMAIDYVWEKFSETWIHPESREIMARAEKINRALEHRPLFPGSEQSREFNEKLRKEIEELKRDHPGISLQE